MFRVGLASKLKTAVLIPILSASLVLPFLSSRNAISERPPAEQRAEFRETTTMTVLSEELGPSSVTELITRNRRRTPANPELVKKLQEKGFQSATRDDKLLDKIRKSVEAEVRQNVTDDQLETSRCFLFAGCNQLEVWGAKKMGLKKPLNFSEAFFHYHDLLEKSDRYIKALFKSVDPNWVGVTDYVYGGGSFDQVAFLMDRYGFVLEGQMRVTHSATRESDLLPLLQSYLDSFKLRVALAKDPAQVGVIRDEAREGVVLLLSRHLGDPPNFVAHPVTGEWITPLDLSQQVFGTVGAEWVTVRRSVTTDFAASAPISGLNMAPKPYRGHSLRLKFDRMQELIRASIKSGTPVYTSLDWAVLMGQENPVMDHRYSRADDLYGKHVANEIQSVAKSWVHGRHAVTLTGFTSEMSDVPGVKRFYKGANSWGDKGPERGGFFASDRLLENRNPAISVHRSLLTAAEDALIAPLIGPKPVVGP